MVVSRSSPYPCRYGYVLYASSACRFCYGRAGGPARTKQRRSLLTPAHADAYGGLWRTTSPRRSDVGCMAITAAAELSQNNNTGGSVVTS